MSHQSSFIHFVLQTENGGENDHINNAVTTATTDETTSARKTVDVRIAAIDNGLAFPFKHPDEWRTYPFHWAWLPQAKIPFSDEIKSQVLPLLSDMNFVQHELCDEIQRLFSLDKNYDRRLVERQLSVMRGQVSPILFASRIYFPFSSLDPKFSPSHAR